MSHLRLIAVLLLLAWASAADIAGPRHTVATAQLGRERGADPDALQAGIDLAIAHETRNCESRRCRPSIPE